VHSSNKTLNGVHSSNKTLNGVHSSNKTLNGVHSSNKVLTGWEKVNMERGKRWRMEEKDRYMKDIGKRGEERDR
jgi:hypothetical protein